MATDTGSLSPDSSYLMESSLKEYPSLEMKLFHKHPKARFIAHRVVSGPYFQPEQPWILFSIGLLQTLKRMLLMPPDRIRSAMAC